MENKNRRTRHFLHFCLLAVSLLALTRCGPSPDSTEPASGTFGSVYKALQRQNCIECHTVGGSGFQAGTMLDLSTQTRAFETLTTLNVTATASSGTCGTAQLVTSGNPSRSYFAAVIFGNYNIPNFGGITGCTPYNGHLTSAYNFSSADQTSITDWITNGAPNN